MAVPKYVKLYLEMLEDNADLFAQLKDLDRKTEEFKAIQRRVIRVVYQAESALCNRTQSTKFNQFSTNLSDKFIAHVRSEYPEIDYTD